MKNDISPPLKEITPDRSGDQLYAEQAFRPVNPPAPHILAASESQRDTSIVQTGQLSTGIMPAPLQSFDGVSNMFGGAPPDTQGDIGPEHYVQWINLHFAVWQIDKINHNSTLVYGPVPGSTLFNGFGGYCETTNDGDPITLYDQFADRWFMSQFALPNYPNGPFYQCIAVSATSDPTGAWYRYAYLWSNTKMNDYPKFGIWPDAYYMTVNQFDSGGYAGVGVAAFERSKMITGDPTAQIIAFDMETVNPNYSSMLPADFDGLQHPPAGSPGIFLEWDDSTWLGDPSDSIRIWEFTVNWAIPSNSTFGLAGLPNYTISTADVDPDMCGYSRECLPQPGTTRKLDAISDRVMYRLQYRNFGDYQTLITNHTVDVDGSDHAGIHWFELRNPSGGWSLHQQGVYSPDSDHRWMGSIALDHQGNAALGYSVSSGTTYPSIRYTGRLADDPSGLMPQGEATMISGGGSQTGFNRWGDYSMMAVDPFDDCTFWYTQEYVEVTGSNTWKTRIGSFRFPSCTTGPTGIISGTITDGSSGFPVPDSQVEGTGLTPPNAFITFSSQDGTYEAEIPEDIYDVSVTSFGYMPETVNNISVISGTITTQNFILDPAPVVWLSGVVKDGNTGWPLYAKISFIGTPLEPIWTDPVTGYYEIQLPDGLETNMHVEAFTPGYLTADISFTLPGNTIQNINLLADIKTCTAPGYTLTTLFSDDFESGYGNWTMTGLWNPENQSDTCGSQVAPFPSPSNAAYYGDDADCNYSTGPPNSGELTMKTPIALSSSTEKLVFSSFENTEKFVGYDNRYVEISTDNGASWSLLAQLALEDSWYESTIDLDAYSGSSILIRFRFDTVDNKQNNFFGWMLDDIAITQACEPPVGGLVVGNVYDANLTTGLTGAHISSQYGNNEITTSTPQDPSVDDGFYSIFSPSGTSTFTATKTGGYASDVQSVAVVLSDTVKQDFYLAAGLLTSNPANLSAVLDVGSSEILTTSINNIGGLSTDFGIVELAREEPALGPFNSPKYVVKPFKQGFHSTERLNLLDQPEVVQLAAGDILQSWPSTLLSGWGLGYNTKNADLWIGDIAAGGGSDLVYRFLTDGSSTGDTIDLSWTGVFAADMTYNPVTSMLWVVDVGGDDCIHELDPENHTPTGNKICPPFPASQRGLAYDPVTDTFFAGSWNDEMIHRFTSGGTMLSSVNVGLATAGLAYNPETKHLFAIVNNAPNTIYVLDADDNFNILGQFTIPGFSDYGGAGLEMDCDGRIWAIDQQAQYVYKVDSGESTNLCSLLNLPWLSAEPVSGTVITSDSRVINVQFDAGVPEVDHPGNYLGQLFIVNDTPYGLVNIPVTMTINTSYGVGLTPATSGISADPGDVITYTLTVTNTGNVTDTFDVNISGNAWVTNSPAAVGPLAYGASQPLQVSVQVPLDASGGDSDSASVSVSSQAEPAQFASSSLTTTVNSSYGVQVSPTSDSLSGDPGQVVTYTLTVTNTGNVTDTFDINISGNAWTTNSPAAVGPLAYGASQPLQVSVQVPLNASGGDSDSASVSVSSQAEPVQFASSSLTTFANNTHGVELFPTSDSLSGDPGQVVTYTLTVTNTGNVTDTFDINISGNAWTTNSPAAVGPLAYGASQPLQVSVQVPVDASSGDSDSASVSVSSQAEPAQFASSSLTTFANNTYGIELFPTSDSLSGDPGQVVTYTLTLINTGNITDTYDINITGNNWTTGAPVAVGPLANGASQPLHVSVHIPLDASGGDSDSASVSVSSQAEPAQFASSSLSTTVNSSYGVQVSPTSDSLSGDPGQVVTYTLTLTNTGNVTETFNVNISGDAWTTNAPAAVGPLANGVSQPLQVSVQIPPDASGGDSDSASVSVSSQAEPAQFASSSLTTTVNSSYGVQVSPAADSLSGDPGQVVTYTLTVTNTSNVTDTYDIDITGNAWTTGAPTAIGPLGKGASQPLQVSVQVPLDATGGDSDTTSVSVSSQVEPAKFASSSLTTTVKSSYGVQVSPTSDSLSGDPGQVVTYSLTMTNTGSLTDTFDVNISGNAWAADAPTSVGPLGKVASQPLQVSVQIPPDASGGDSDTASVSINSQMEPAQSASSSLTTIVNNIYDIELFPTSDSLSSDPGQVVTYTLTLTNTGNVTETFNVNISGNVWAADAPASVGPLGKGASQPLQVSIQIPPDASGGDSDSASVSVSSQTEPAQFASSSLSTTVNSSYGVQVSPTSDSLSGDPGQMITYTLTVTNTGNITDTYDIDITGNNWTTGAPAVVGPLANGASQPLQVSVQIPPDASGGDSDTASVSVSSQAEPAQFASSSLSTTIETAINYFRLFLPLTVN